MKKESLTDQMKASFQGRAMFFSEKDEIKFDSVLENKNILKQREKVDEVTCVVTNMDKMSLEDKDNEELVIRKTIEDAINKRLRSEGKAEEEETVRIGEKISVDFIRTHSSH